MKKILLALVILFSALSANAYDFDKFSISGGAEVISVGMLVLDFRSKN